MKQLFNFHINIHNQQHFAKNYNKPYEIKDLPESCTAILLGVFNYVQNPMKKENVFL